MKQSEIWDIDFNPTEGSEQQDIRPGIVLSGNAMNDHLNLIIVCPITSRMKYLMGNVILKKNKRNGLVSDSEILVFQVRCISKSRLQKYRGKVEAAELKLIHQNLAEILTY